MARQVTPRQLELLLDFLEEHQSLALGKVRGREGNALSKRLWRQCADILNADAGGLSKSGPEWKKYYNQYKSRTKAKLRQIKEGRIRTGGGPAPQMSLFPLEERLISIVGGCSSPLPVRHNPLDALSFEPATDAGLCPHSGGHEELIVVHQDADLPTVTPINARQVDIEYLEVLSDAASCSENGVAEKTRGPNRNPPKRRRRNRRSSSPKDNKEVEAAEKRLIRMEQSRIEVDRELARGMPLLWKKLQGLQIVLSASMRSLFGCDDVAQVIQATAAASELPSSILAKGFVDAAAPCSRKRPPAFFLL